MVLLFYRAVNIARDKNSVRTWDQIYGHSQDVLSRSQVVVAYKFLHRDHIWQFAGICMQIASCCRLQVLIQGKVGCYKKLSAVGGLVKRQKRCNREIVFGRY